MEVSLSPGRLMGAFNAGVADEAWGDLPKGMLSNPRVRFWFTERGWRVYGLRVAAGARASGRAFRVVRRKNPPKSMVVYRDDWQVALLPDRNSPIITGRSRGPDQLCVTRLGSSSPGHPTGEGVAVWSYLLAMVESGVGGRRWPLAFPHD